MDHTERLETMDSLGGCVCTEIRYLRKLSIADSSVFAERTEHSSVTIIQNCIFRGMIGQIFDLTG